MHIPFSPPRIDERTIEAVTDVLRSGWITTGPKTQQLENGISQWAGGKPVVCLNSWTNACELILRWFGVGEGDEVIVPAYTYAATANIVVHTGATPVMIDTDPDTCLVSAASIAAAITKRTKVIMPVDIGGMPVDYNGIATVIAEAAARFHPSHPNQEKLGRILFLADAAHSFGATYEGRYVGDQADVTGYSFHAVKNLTTAEGGAVVLNLPEPFDNEEIKREIKRSSLHGQTKDALSKTVTGGWRYDIVEAGYKCNMTDLQAAIGCVELDRYADTLVERERICKRYSEGLANDARFIVPTFVTSVAKSAFHLYTLRIANYSEADRDALIDQLKDDGIASNVHFQPLPLLSFYRNLGYSMADYPNAYGFYCNEISLPVWYGLSDDQIDRIVSALKKFVKHA
jgi:dTDP-4-amino-4,6-dideoxygalactose transaminase